MPTKPLSDCRARIKGKGSSLSLGEAAPLWNAAGGAESGAAPPAAPGLVYAAYVPAKSVNLGPDEVGLMVAQGGGLLRFVGQKRPGSGPVGFKRGKVRGMSRAAMLNQRRFIDAVDRRRIKGQIFVTLTLRGGSGVGLVESWDLIEAARRKWFKRLERAPWMKSRRWFAMWRKEPHKSGHAHLHVLIFFLDEPPHLVRQFRPWNDQAWAECVGDPSIRSTACRSELIRSWGGVASYCAKYLAKPQAMEGIETGKVWGVYQRQNVPVDWSLEVVARPVAVKVQRVCRKLHQRRSTTWQAFLDGKWLNFKAGYWRGRLITLENQIEHFRAQGVRLRRRRPRLSCTREIRIWADVCESDGSGKQSHRVEPMDVPPELHTFYTSTYFGMAPYVSRLISWAKAAVLDELLAEDELPPALRRPLRCGSSSGVPCRGRSTEEPKADSG